MIMFCTYEGDHQVNAMLCAYSCPRSVKMKCAEYKRNYEKLKSLLIAGQYLTKYGLPNFPDPNVKEKERTRKVRADKGQPKPKVKEVEKPAPAPVAIPADEAPKRTRRTKKQMEEARRQMQHGE
jgi:hypothetical protein